MKWDQLPARIEAVIAERMAVLPEKCRKLLAVASVQGETFILEVVARAVGCRPSQAFELLNRVQSNQHDLVRALSTEILTIPHGDYVRNQTLSRYRFRHFLFQQYLYQNLNPVAKSWLHRVTGEGLENFAEVLDTMQSLRETRPSRLAWHFEQAGQATKAAKYYLQAGKNAFRLSAIQEAISYFQQGLDLLRDTPDTPERARQELSLQLALGSALQAGQGYSHPEAGKALHRAKTLCDQVGNAGQSFRVLWLLGLYYRWQGELQASYQLGTELLELAIQAEDPTQVMLANWAVGWDLKGMGELVAAQTHLEQVLALYAPQQHRALALRFGLDPGGIAQAHLTDTLWMLGYPDQALAERETASNLARQLDHPVSLVSILGILLYLYFTLRDFEAAQTRAEELIRLSTKYGLSHLLNQAVLFRGAALVRRGQVETGLVDLERTVKELETSGAVVLEPMLVELAVAYGLAGKPEVGLPLLEQALAATPGTGIRYLDAEIHRYWGELLEMQGTDSAEVEKHYRQAIQIAHKQEAKSWELRATTSLARLWQSEGKTEEAYQTLAEIYNWFTEGFDTPDLKDAKELLKTLA